MGACLSYFNCLKAPGHSKPKPTRDGANGLEARVHDDEPQSRGIEPSAPHTNGDEHSAAEPGITPTPPAGVPAPAAAPADAPAELVTAEEPPASGGGATDPTAQETDTAAVPPPTRADTIEIVIGADEDPLGRGPTNPPIHGVYRPPTGGPHAGRPPQGPRSR